MFATASFAKAKIWKQPKCPAVDEWMKRRWYEYAMEHHSAVKKNEILPFTTIGMDVEGIKLNEIRQTQKNTICSLSHVRHIIICKSQDLEATEVSSSG